MDANALHAGVYFEVDFGAAAHGLGGGVDLGQLFHGGGGDGEVVLQEERYLVADDAAHYQNGGGDTRFAQQNALFEKGHAQVWRADSDHVAGNFNETMPVGVGFEDGHDLCGGHGRFYRPVVFCQTRQVYGNGRWPEHAIAADSGLVEHIADFTYFVDLGGILTLQCSDQTVALSSGAFYNRFDSFTITYG
jgi:hypothetical protein